MKKDVIIHSDRAGDTSARSGTAPAINLSLDFQAPSNSPSAIPISELVLRLKSHGVLGETEAIEFLLSHIGYRTITRFAHVVKNRLGADKLTISNIHTLILFDLALQSVILKGIGVFELQFRAQYSHLMAINLGAFSHRDPSNFTNMDYFNDFLKDYSRELSRKIDRKVEPIYREYNEYADVPIWQAVELMSFGTISKLYKNTRNKTVLRGVADSFRIEYNYLSSWMRTFSEARNRCAHFDNICITPIVFKPKKIPGINVNNSSVFYVVLALQRLLESGAYSATDTPTVMHSLNFTKDINDLQAKFSPETFIGAGFPINWGNILIKGSTTIRRMDDKFIVGETPE